MTNRNTDELIQATHPGFTIICQQCGSRRVTVEDDRGWSHESGGWGGVSLVCQDCDNSAEIADHC